MSFSWTDFINGELGASVRNKINLLGQWARDIALEKTLAEGHTFIGDQDGNAAAVDFSTLALPVLIECNAQVSLTKGQPVYIAGTAASGKPIVNLADNSVAATMPCIGLVSADTTGGEDVLIQANGLLNGLDTSSYTAGQALYINGAGLLTTTKPTGTALIQKVGVVSRSHATAGSIVIQGAGRVNDLPNLAQNKLWRGDTDGVAEEINESDLKHFNEVHTPVTGNYTITGWNTALKIDNTASASDQEITLPEATTASDGKELKLWIIGDPSVAGQAIKFLPHDATDTVNGVTGTTEKVIATINQSRNGYSRQTIQCDGDNLYLVEKADDVSAPLSATDLVVSGISSTYNRQYAVATIQGTITEASYAYTFNTDSAYRIYVIQVSTTYYFVAYDTTSSQWICAYTTTDPETWTDGVDIGASYFLKSDLATDTEEHNGGNSPASTDVSVSYVGV